LISGADFVLARPARPDDADFIVRGLTRLWPRAVIQNASESSPVPAVELRFPVQLEREFFVYESHESFVSWQADGLTEANQASMVHVLCTDQNVTLVADRIGSELAENVAELVNALRVRSSRLDASSPAARVQP